MKIILAQYRPAIRLWKYAVTLENLGHQVTILSTSPPVPHLDWNDFQIYNYYSYSQYSDKSLYISFNPGTITALPPPKCNTNHMKIVQAVGDLHGFYNRKHYDNERRAMELSDTVYFVSHRQAWLAHEKYGVSCDGIVNNAVLSEMDSLERADKQSGYVYAGTLTDQANHHRNIYKQLKTIAKDSGEVIHIYPSSLGVQDCYLCKEFKIHNTAHPYKLITELSNYKVGICENASADVRGLMLPNKFYEYLAAGCDLVYADDCHEIKREHRRFITGELTEKDLYFEERNREIFENLLT